MWQTRAASTSSPSPLWWGTSSSTCCSGSAGEVSTPDLNSSTSCRQAPRFTERRIDNPLSRYPQTHYYGCCPRKWPAGREDIAGWRIGASSSTIILAPIHRVSPYLSMDVGFRVLAAPRSTCFCDRACAFRLRADRNKYGPLRVLRDLRAFANMSELF